jgi:RNA polymerase sigma-70 factor, ECF subfamily
VHDARGMRLGQTRACLQQVVDGVCDRERTDPKQPTEIDAGQVLHDEIRRADRQPTDVEHPDDMLAGQPCAGSCLPKQAGRVSSITEEDLQRHATLQLDVLCRENDSHAAASDLVLDAIFSCDEIPDPRKVRDRVGLRAAFRAFLGTARRCPEGGVAEHRCAHLALGNVRLRLRKVRLVEFACQEGHDGRFGQASGLSVESALPHPPESARKSSEARAFVYRVLGLRQNVRMAEPEDEPTLARIVAAGRAAWPEIDVDDGTFARYVNALATESLPPVAYASDLYLACACAIAVPGAAAAFHREYEHVIKRVLSRRRASSDDADDAAQTIHERLLLAKPGAPPKITEYAGRGSLRSWVSTMAATTLLMMQRASNRRREEPPDEASEFANIASSAAPDLAYMKTRYKSELEEAIVVSLESLSVRERAILKLHLGQRLSIDRIGAMYRVDRSTAARWIAAARDALIAAARSAARARLRLTDEECESIAELVRSELHVSIVRLLG